MDYELAPGRRVLAFCASPDGRRAAVASDAPNVPPALPLSQVFDIDEETVAPEERRRRVRQALDAVSSRYGTVPSPPSTPERGDSDGEGGEPPLKMPARCPRARRQDPRLEVFEVSCFGGVREASFPLPRRLGRRLRLRFDDHGDVLVAQGDEAPGQEHDWVLVWRRSPGAPGATSAAAASSASTPDMWHKVCALSSSECCVRRQLLATLSFDGCAVREETAWGIHIFDVSAPGADAPSRGAPPPNGPGPPGLRRVAWLPLRWPQTALPIRVGMEFSADGEVLHVNGVMEVDHLRNIMSFFFSCWFWRTPLPFPSEANWAQPQHSYSLLKEWASTCPSVRHVEFAGCSRAPRYSPCGKQVALLFDSGDEDDEAEVLMLLNIDPGSPEYGEVISRTMLTLRPVCDVCNDALLINAQDLLWSSDGSKLVVCGGQQDHILHHRAPSQPCAMEWFDFVALVCQEPEGGQWSVRRVIKLRDSALSLNTDRDMLWVGDTEDLVLVRTNAPPLPMQCLPLCWPQVRLVSTSSGCEVARVQGRPRAIGEPAGPQMGLVLRGACPAVHLPGYGTDGLGVSVRPLARLPWTVERLLWAGQRGGGTPTEAPQGVGGGLLARLPTEPLRRLVALAGRSLRDAMQGGDAAWGPLAAAAGRPTAPAEPPWPPGSLEG